MKLFSDIMLNFVMLSVYVREETFDLGSNFRTGGPVIVSRSPGCLIPILEEVKKRRKKKYSDYDYSVEC